MEHTLLTLGSLFDGSGGFPLGGLLAGITPVWASEIEPFPIRVTTKRFPNMKHYGDISRMDGGKIEPVDIITFGSPCTDMSIAGKRAGLDGAQSSLFYQAIRIIKEMRCATNGRYPRWICWENVVGAFSSNKGFDFKAVLEAVIGIIEPGAEVPMPEKDRWPYADIYMGDRWSVAYRTFDAQYWGVPQRRRRIYLVGDLAGQCAGQVLFESEGLSGYSTEGFRSWQRAARDTAAGLGAAGGICLNDQGGNRMDISVGVSGTLRAQMDGHPPCVLAAGFCKEPSAQSRSIGYEEECAPTLRAGAVPAAVALESHPMDGRIKIDESGSVQTLTSRMGTGGMNVPLLLKIRSGCEGGGKGALIQKDASATLSCNNDQTLFVPKTYAVTMGSYTQVSEEQAPTLMARDFKDPAFINTGYSVRRLTPTECARLQGFPDFWCAGLDTPEPSEEDIAFWSEVWETHRRVIGGSTKAKSRNQIIKWLQHPHSDAAEYKMWGNGVALPNVFLCWRALCGLHNYPASNLSWSGRETTCYLGPVERICDYQKNKGVHTMTINYNVTGTERKRLADYISGFMGTEKKYLGAPTFAYQVGYLTVSKDGAVSFEDRGYNSDIDALMAELEGQGFHTEDTIPKADTTEPETAPAAEDDGRLTIQMPITGFTPEALTNLTNLLAAKGHLIRKAIGAADLPVEVSSDTVSFPWFSGETTGEEVKAYTHLVTALCGMARNQKRITAKEKNTDNDKYAFRCFLLRLGFIGAEYKDERKILLRNLSGNSAFKSGARKEVGADA